MIADESAMEETEVPLITLALDELANLSQAEYLKEIQNNPPQVLNVLNMNSKYVSNVSIAGYKKFNIRYKPYNPLLKPHRVRTKSENNDAVDASSTKVVQSVLDDTVKDLEDCISQLKKAKSLESILGTEEHHFKIPEMDCVSDRIEKLKVDE